jgi:flagellum-specific ATP synthase
VRESELGSLRRLIDQAPLYRRAGRLRSATGLLSCSLTAAVGDHCEIHPGGGRPAVLAEVIGFQDGLAYLAPYDNLEHVQAGMPVVPLGGGLRVPVGPGVLGRVLDGLGRPLDGKGELRNVSSCPINRPPPAPLERVRIRAPFVTGVRAIDGLLTCGRGQRVGIFAGAGVGKSTLLGEVARGAEADLNVLALVGERGREVGPFLEDCLARAGWSVRWSWWQPASSRP